MFYRAEPSFQPVWMRRKGFFYVSLRFSARTGTPALHQQMGLGTAELGFAKLTPKSKKRALKLLHTELIKPSQALQRASSRMRQLSLQKSSKVPPVQGHKDPLAQ